MLKNKENDIALAIFINRMKTTFLRAKIKYINELSTRNKYENELFPDDNLLTNDFEIGDNYILEQLKDEEIELLELFYIQGYSYKEISKMKNEKIETVRKRRNRAVSKVRKMRRNKDEL